LPDLGYEAYCAYLHAPDDGAELFNRAKQLDAPLISVPDKSPIDLRAISRLIHICREQKVKIWHGHDYKSNLFGLFVRRRCSIKLVTTVHGWVHHTRRTPFYYALDKWAIRRYQKVICVSDDLYRECLKLRIAKEKCHLVHNAIDVDEFQRTMSTATARQKFGQPHSGVLLGAMGRLAGEKAFDLLIQAIDRLVKSGRDVSLWIAGDGGERESLQQLIDKLALTNRVRLLGHVRDIKTFFQALDVFVLSSLREGLPNVVLEAMAMEVPVVATRVAGVPSLVSHGETGLLIEPNSVDAIVAGIESLLQNSASGERFARAARANVERSYSFKVRMQKIAAIYDEVLSHDKCSERLGHISE